MKLRSHRLFPIIALSISAMAGQASFSGKVTNPSGTGKAGVTVMLASTRIATQTDAQGNWSLTSGTVGIQEAKKFEPLKRNLVTRNDDHLRISFSGSDISGRRIDGLTARSPRSPDMMPLALRATGAPDTLVYSFNGKSFLRDTLSNDSLTGIARTFDTTWNAAITYGYLTDIRDGQVYRTVKIGSQVWMAQNLNFDGQYTPASLCYDDSKDSCAHYGRLYNRTAAGFACPNGWHLPDTTEWGNLQAAIDPTRADAGRRLKSKIWWNATAASMGTDEFGFRGLPGGSKSLTSPSYANMSSYGSWWSATPFDASNFWSAYMHRMSSMMALASSKSTNAISIRCVQDQQ
ncbi:MAG: hypothetical protein RL318_2762 [Fibrobacterota bacterium]|jgi:uncharacterized protein (TIGR02145 family)